MAEEFVRIVSWPEKPAELEHHFVCDKPCPVSIIFDDAPARVAIQTTPKRPLYVDMSMDLTAEEPVPVCIQLCEPICAESRYKVGIVILDRPTAVIRLKGMTKLFSC